MKTNKAMGTGLISAFAASLCCITPLIAMVAGIGGISSTFSFMEPLRPYLMGLTVLALGYAWYKHIQVTRNEIECACDDDEVIKKNFLNTRGFLVSVTIMSVILMGVPYYSEYLVTDEQPQIVYVNTNNIQEVEYDVEGMTCSACEIHVNKSAKMVDGVISAESDHTTGVAHIKFDNSKTSNTDVIKSIEVETGYKVVNQKIINKD
jgi:mercuric ion transport protein